MHKTIRGLYINDIWFINDTNAKSQIDISNWDCSVLPKLLNLKQKYIQLDMLLVEKVIKKACNTNNFNSRILIIVLNLIIRDYNQLLDYNILGGA